MFENNVKRFEKLFRGNPDAYGVYNYTAWESGDENQKKGWTLSKPLEPVLYENHLLGKGNKGLGVIPLATADTSWFGVIDFDNHETGNPVNLKELERKCQQHKYPLVICRSKSGGAHAYLFAKEPLHTRMLRQALDGFLPNLSGIGEDKIEVFPKQDTLDEDRKGNWINLPYFNMQSNNCLNSMFEKGSLASLERFLDYAEAKRIDNRILLELCTDIHKDAPPCIQIMLSSRVPQGCRNDSLFHVSVYFKRAFPHSWESMAFDFNASNMETPLSYDEVKSVIKSVRDNQYKYFCNRQPMKSHCKSATCVTRKFGITPEEKNDIMLSTLPEIGSITKYLLDPPEYEIIMDGRKMMFKSEDLLDFRKFAKVVFERMDIVLSPIKNPEWRQILTNWLEDMITVVAPDDASRSGIMRAIFLEYMKQAKLDSSGEEKQDRIKLSTAGSPIIQKLAGTRYFVFKSDHFRTHLQKKRLGNVTGADVWRALKELGVHSKSMRVQGKACKFWAIEMIDDTDMPKIDMFTGDDTSWEDIDPDDTVSYDPEKAFPMEF